LWSNEGRGNKDTNGKEESGKNRENSMKEKRKEEAKEENNLAGSKYDQINEEMNDCDTQCEAKGSGASPPRRLLA
jgi:hypothetical protein